MFSMGFGVQSPPVWHFWVDDFLLPCRWDSSLEGTQSPIFRCQWKSQLMQLYFSFHLEYLIPFVKLDFPLSFLFGKKHRGNVLEGNTPTKPLFPPCFRFFFGGGPKTGFCGGVKKKRWKASSHCHCVNCCFVLQAIRVFQVCGVHKKTKAISGWWFQKFFIFTPIWGRFPFWLIFFKWVETTNQNLHNHIGTTNVATLVLFATFQST